jgi:hypothetical protein
VGELSWCWCEPAVAAAKEKHRCDLFRIGLLQIYCDLRALRLSFLLFLLPFSFTSNSAANAGEQFFSARHFGCFEAAKVGQIVGLCKSFL